MEVLYLIYIIGGILLVATGGMWLLTRKRSHPWETTKTNTWEEPEPYSVSRPVPPLKTPSARTLVYPPRGTTEQRSARRRNVIRSHTEKKTKPHGVYIPDDMFWDELLGEICYLEEEWSYRRDLEAYEAEKADWERQREEQANHDTLSFRRPSDPLIPVADPDSPRHVVASAVILDIEPVKHHDTSHTTHHHDWGSSHQVYSSHDHGGGDDGGGGGGGDY